MSKQETQAVVKQLVEAWWEAGGYAGRGSAISVLEDGLATALAAARAQALADLKPYVRHKRDCDLELVHRGVKFQRLVDTECTCGLAAALAASPASAASGEVSDGN